MPPTAAAAPERRYNFAHFHLGLVLRDLWRTLRAAGVRPGECAPDFALPASEDGVVRLGDLRGTPVLLHFGSYT